MPSPLGRAPPSPGERAPSAAGAVSRGDSARDSVSEWTRAASDATSAVLVHSGRALKRGRTKLTRAALWLDVRVLPSVLDPTSTTVLRWDVVVLLALLYTAVFTPFEISMMSAGACEGRGEGRAAPLAARGRVRAAQLTLPRSSRVAHRLLRASLPAPLWHRAVDNALEPAPAVRIARTPPRAPG